MTQENNTPRKILYVDMDNVLVDFVTGINRIDIAIQNEYEWRLDEVPGIFALMDPMKDAISSYERLSEKYDTYILSTSPWNNPTAWYDKLEWVKKHLWTVAHKRLILSHHKNLNIWDYLIDDRTKNGADRFSGELVLFWSEQYPDWKKVCEYLI